MIAPQQLAFAARSLSLSALAAAAPALQAAPQAPLPLEDPPASAAALVPGALPADASPRARELWKALVAAVSGQAQGSIQAFDLEFDGQVYSGERQSNDIGARYLFLAPRFVKVVLASGRERLRGPEGDFLVEKGKPVSLAGRDFKEDRRELDETLSVARTFVGLTDPTQLRLARLEVLEAPPGGLPASMAAEARALEWISVLSPDFRGRSDGAAPAALDRVEIGLDRQTHLPALAVVGDPVDRRTAVLVRLGDYRPLDGWRVPGRLTTWRVDPDPANRTAAFAAKPAIALWLVQGRLRPQLRPQDFLPPAG